ncbi:recombinase family protein [Anaerotruncus sp. AF02-27]|uniref:recombinase family protein n=1 Tax=Anaerotruncus sp. AF02-27 TaxID=2292191 RepID=UPI000E55086A|nr:recombinase family protein [Anaerotruncus sp. AF02-27]RGX56766.1 recombinase family protein [Anaerotruncus sp. AF02-27]
MNRQRTEGSSALQERKVIVIEAAQRPEVQKLRVAAYCRVSSESSDQFNSFIAQTNYYTGLITQNPNWTMADIYADEGISGTSAEKRPEFQRLIADCRRGRIDRVLVKSISRFARNTKECMETIRALKAIGVGVCFEEQNIDTSQMSGELLTAMFAAIAQKESESISENQRWSYQHRMQSGNFITCKAPFGYRLSKNTLEVYEPEAKIVREIFSRYLQGDSKDDIAQWASTLGVKTRDGKDRWQHTTISYILRNERYVGDALLQKRYTTDSFPHQKKRNLGERDQYYRIASHPAIIDREIFNAAKKLLELRAKKVVTEKTANDPMAKKIVCGACGTMFRKKACGGITYWECRNHNRDKDSCPITQIPEREIHAAFLRLYHKLIHGEPILKELLLNLQAIRERRLLWSEGIIRLNKRICDLTDQDHTLSRMNQCGLVDPDIFISQSNELARQLIAAKQEKEQLLAAAGDDSIPKTRELLETLESAPEYLPRFDGEIFGDLTEKIVAENNTSLRFILKNGLELTEKIERTVR